MIVIKVKPRDKMFGGWKEVRYIVLGQCSHIFTACGECISDWSTDYRIRMVVKSNAR